MSQFIRFRLGIRTFFIFSLGLAIGLTLYRYSPYFFREAQTTALPYPGCYYTEGILPGGEWLLPVTVAQAISASGHRLSNDPEIELVVRRVCSNGTDLEIKIDMNDPSEMQQQLLAGDTLRLRQLKPDEF